METLRRNRLYRHVHGGHVERLEHDLRHALSESLGVRKNFCEQDEKFLARNPEQSVETVVPDFLHVVPVREYTVSNGIHQCQDTTLALRLVDVSRGSRGTAALSLAIGFSSIRGTLKIDVVETNHVSKCIPRTSKAPLRYEVSS